MTLKRKLGSAMMLIAILSAAWLGLTGETSAKTIRSTALPSSGGITFDEQLTTC